MSDYNSHPLMSVLRQKFATKSVQFMNNILNATEVQQCWSKYDYQYL